MFDLAVPWWELVLRALAVYGLMLVGLRVLGKRQVGQFTLFDLVLVLLLANAVQPAITGPDLSLGGGMIIMATLLAANFAVAQLRLRSPAARGLLEGTPRVLAVDGAWLMESIRREELDLDDCEQAIREHGLESVEQVKLAMLEVDGTISIVPSEDLELRRSPRPVRRRSRTMRGR